MLNIHSSSLSDLVDFLTIKSDQIDLDIGKRIIQDPYFFTTWFDFYQSVPVFPRLDILYNFSIWISIKQRGSLLESNRVPISVRLCPFGYALEADVNSFYKCVPCLAGAFANSTAESITTCSKCPAGKYSLEKSTYCMDCPEGKFSRDIGQADFCSNCAPGLYSSGFGNHV
jgi:hypothetical protein